MARDRTLSSLACVDADTASFLTDMQPALEHIRRGEWRLMIIGPASSAERALASMFQARLLDALERLEAKR